MAKRTFKVELKDEKSIKGLVQAVKQGCAANGIDFSGDEKKGHAKKAGATIDYVVSGTVVTIDVEDSFVSRAGGWDAARIENEVRKWIKPYTK